MSTTPVTSRPAPASAPGVVATGWLAADSSLGRPDERKVGRALAASLFLHGVGLVLILAAMAWGPKAVFESVSPPERYEFVFVQAMGPGGGGGGGGHTTPEPPRKLEMKAEVPKPPTVTPVPVPVPVTPPTLVAPVQTAAPVIQTAGAVMGLSAAPSLGTGTDGGAGAGAGAGSGPGEGAGIGPGTGGGFGGGAMRPGNGVQEPTLLRGPDPSYTPDAMRAKVQGVVELEAVLSANGSVTDVRVLKSLDRTFGLDEEAMRTARQWLFRPARFQGQAVAYVVVIQMEFRLH